MTAIERAYELARTGNYANFTAIKKALRRDFNVDHELAGRLLATSLTRMCKEARETPAATSSVGYASQSR